MDSQQQYADAMRAFDAYYGTRRRVMGQDWPARRYAEHRSWRAFLKLAEKCAGDGVDVERFVTVALEHCPKNGCEVVPNDLLRKWADEAWRRDRAAKRMTAADEWAMNVRAVLQIQAGGGQSDEAILASGFNVRFPAWFRVFYPERMSTAIVEKYGSDAVDELKADRDALRFLRSAMAGKVEEFERRMGVIDGLQS